MAGEPGLHRDQRGVGRGRRLQLDVDVVLLVIIPVGQLTPQTLLLVAKLDALAGAVAELRGYQTWLKEKRLPAADDRFALGRDGYRAMLRGENGKTAAEYGRLLGFVAWKRLPELRADGLVVGQRREGRRVWRRGRGWGVDGDGGCLAHGQILRRNPRTGRAWRVIPQ